MPEEILVERPAPHIVRLVINRAEKLNALTKPMWKQLGDLALELAKDDDIRCLMLRGAGEKAFGPGNDISEFANERSNVEQARSYGRIMHDTLTALQDFPAPTVAQIHGICVGGGMEIAGCCDIRIAGASSRFGAPIKNLGLVMAYGELEALVGLVGPSAAKEVLFEGRILMRRKPSPRVSSPVSWLMRRLRTRPCSLPKPLRQVRPWSRAGTSASSSALVIQRRFRLRNMTKAFNASAQKISKPDTRPSSPRKRRSSKTDDPNCRRIPDGRWRRTARGCIWG